MQSRSGAAAGAAAGAGAGGSELHNDAVVAGLVRQYLVKHRMTDAVRLFDEEHPEVREYVCVCIHVCVGAFLCFSEGKTES